MTGHQTAFDAPGNFYRGNLHTHSTLSDGALSPAEVCRRYRAEGYDFICLSDHMVGVFDYPIADTRDFRTNDFTTILGAEVHLGQMANGEIWHILTVGLPLDFDRPHAPAFVPDPASESMTDLARRCRDAGAFVAIAHPQWNGMTDRDARLIDAAHAVEIYNHGCAVEADRGDGCAVWDQLLSDGWRLSGCATDDAHFKCDDHFGGWVMVKSASLDPDSLLTALKAGHYYSTQGPEIRDIRVDGDCVHIACSPASRIIAIGHGAAAKQSLGAGLTEAALPLERFMRGGWLRVTVVDAHGNHAWSNPIWLN